MRMMKRSSSALVAVFAASMAAHATTTLQQRQPGGAPKLVQLAHSFLDALNSGDKQIVTDFVQSNFSEASLKRSSLESYVRALQKLQEQSGGFQIVTELPTGNPNAVRFQLRSKRGNKWATLATRWDPSQPTKLDGFGFRLMDDPASTKWTETKISPEATLKEIEQHVSDAVAADRFSGVVLVAKGDTILMNKAYGLADEHSKSINKLDTKFNLGSMNKMFTSVAIAQLVQAGKLSYEDKLSKVLPDFPNKEAADKTTIHQLLTHTSGLGDYFTPQFFANREKFLKPGDYLPVFGSQPLLFEPATSWRYSNFGYVVLGAVVERVSGEGYFDYVKAHIFEPAGMSNSDSYSIDQKISNLAAGYTRFGGEGVLGSDPLGIEPRRSNLDTMPWKGSPAGGGYSTAHDLFKFARALRTCKLVNQQLTEKITSGQVDAPFGKYGYGFEPGAEGSVRGHSGGAPGINSDLKILWEKDYIVVLMSNYDPPAAQDLAEQIAGFLLKQG
jgi:D-alanyl-D-alanine carboxypeptidase